MFDDGRDLLSLDGGTSSVLIYFIIFLTCAHFLFISNLDIQLHQRRLTCSGLKLKVVGAMGHSPSLRPESASTMRLGAERSLRVRVSDSADVLHITTQVSGIKNVSVMT